MTILQVTYQRVYRLGQYESERLEAVASVEDGDTAAAWAEAVATVEHEYACLCAVRLPSSTAPKTAAEAEVRFFLRYSETIGGGTWADVQRYTGNRAPKPTTIEGWIASAEAVRDKAKEGS